MIKRLVGVSFVLVVLAIPLHAAASNQPTLKTQIVAPECTLDTIDNGSGPTQVITCPPEAVDLIVTPEGIDVGKTSQPALNPQQVGLRLQSPASVDEIGTMLSGPGVIGDLLEGNPGHRWDVLPEPYNELSTVQIISLLFIIIFAGVALTGVSYIAWRLLHDKHQQ